MLLIASLIVVAPPNSTTPGMVWILVTVVYCTTFLVSRFSDEVDIPSEVYIFTEYVLYLTTSVVVVLLPGTPPPPLQEIEVIPPPPINVVARERALERRHR